MRSDHYLCPSPITVMDAPPAPEYGSTSTLVHSLSIVCALLPTLHTAQLHPATLRFLRAFALLSPLTSFCLISTPPPLPLPPKQCIDLEERYE